MAGENSYPNADNYPVSSFRHESPPPDVDPDEGALIYVGYNPEWQKFLEGALMQLLLPSTYAGDHDAKILALNRAETLRFILTEPINITGDYPTPYWDEDQDLDDEASAETQAWYGEVSDPEAPADELTFQENASIWIITGFLAITGEVGAALFFHTVAPKFALAFRRGSVGEIIRIVIDSADFGSVDTTPLSVGESVEAPIVAGSGEHDILLVKMS